MKIIDITKKFEKTYFSCLEDWSEEIKEAGTHKESWYDKMKEKGLRVKLAINDEEKAVGMIQYLPIEQSIASGNDLYFILCIWVHGYEQGVGNNQKQGIGKELLKTAEEDVKKMNAKGVAAWGVSLPFWMRASWFKKQGYKKVDKDGMAVLLWKPFNTSAQAPKWIRRKKSPEIIQGKVSVNAFINGWCPAQSLVFERAKRAALEFGDDVIFREIDTSDRETYLEWGISDALFIDKTQIRTGPPPSYEKIRKQIQKNLKRKK